MKFFAVLILSMLLGYLVYIFNSTLPWWCVSLAAFIAAASVPLKPWLSFVAGFAGIFLLWSVLVFWLDKENGGVLSAKMAQVLPFNGSAIVMMLASALIGGIVGGFSALTGSFIRKKPASSTH
ncbi:MAG TPA: hypothetical protein VLC98_06450 [Phnomibacter sp.]|nr:hypothetical protein [Phnomibacter sp.]